MNCECCGEERETEWCTDSEDGDIVVALCEDCRRMLSVEEL